MVRGDNFHWALLDLIYVEYEINVIKFYKISFYFHLIK